MEFILLFYLYFTWNNVKKYQIEITANTSVVLASKHNYFMPYNILNLSH